MMSLTLQLVFMILVLFSIVISSFGGLESWSICFLCICLFIMLSIVSSSWCHGLASTCDCDTSLGFHLTFLIICL